MRTIPRGYLQALTRAISSLSVNAQAVAVQTLNKLISSGNYASPVELVEDLINAIEPLLQSATGSSASVTANAYDLLRMAAIDEPLGAEPFADHDFASSRDALYSIATAHPKFQAFASELVRRIDYEVKRASGVTMTSNGLQDRRKPRFARVPQGPTTCPFCIMLASRGFDYVSEKSAGALNKFHANCDCKVVPQWGGESYEGYDPDEYLDQYAKLMDEGKLNSEQLNRASQKARERRRLGK